MTATWTNLPKSTGASSSQFKFLIDDTYYFLIDSSFKLLIETSSSGGGITWNNQAKS